MKLFQNRKVIGLFCIIFAAVIAFVAAPAINKSKSNTIKIIKLNCDVESGTKITDDMVREIEVGAYGLPDRIISDKGEIVGKYANCEIKSDDIILASKLSDYAADEKLDGIFNNGYKLVTVTVSSNAAAVGNHIKSGDYISILIYRNDTVEAFDELRNIEIYSIENDEAQAIKEGNEDTENIVSTVTLIANEEQAEQLVYAEYSGKLHAVLERRGKLQ